MLLALPSWLWQPKMSPDIVICPPGGAKSTLDANHCFRRILFSTISTVIHPLSFLSLDSCYLSLKTKNCLEKFYLKYISLLRHFHIVSFKNSNFIEIRKLERRKKEEKMKIIGPYFENHCQDFPGGPVVKTQCFQCRGSGFNPWLEN